jgi:peptidyl-dipeptidase A
MGGYTLNEKMQNFLDLMIPTLSELHKTASDAYWKSTTTGEKEWEDRHAQLNAKLMKVYANRDAFAELKAMKASGEVTDPLLARQLVTLYDNFAANQTDEQDIDEMVRRETEIASLFTQFRATVDGEKVSDNVIHDILAHETDNTKRQAAWESSKQIGEVVADKVIDLVKYRNEVARKMGYSNFYSMALSLQELDETELFAVLAELETASNEPFANMKADLDAELAPRYGIAPSAMRPWHYADPFFQEAPASNELDLNQYYADQDVTLLTKKFYDSIGLEIQDILDNSDLYEREGKYQHAYCMDVDRAGDVRVLCNNRNNEYWMGTMLHELGHAVYNKCTDKDLPWQLRNIAHILTTEAIAMLFGRLSKNAQWLHEMVGISAEEAQALEAATTKQLTRSMLIFVRWGLVMTHFERALYSNPDQDLNTLWWDLVERFQMITRPENRNLPDWAAKIHLGMSPVYYQNYVLGELTASQLLAAIERDLSITSLTGHPEVGTWLTDNVFKVGARYHWNTMIEKATGEPLSAKYFVKQFVQ